tara:strand:- start:735 stop:1454 length:720 start_codon:yes stop_codon:yes gene_type:complete
MKKNIWAIIAARSGSKGVKNKNIKPLNKKPLIAYTIKSAIKSGVFEKIFVLTDSIKYAKMAKKYGAEIPFIRPKKISRDLSTDNELYEFIFKFLNKKKIKPPDFFAHLSPTVPIRSNNVIRKGVEYFYKKKRLFQGMRSVSEMSQTAYRNLRIIDGKLCSITKKDFDLNKLNQPRQLYPKTYIANGLIDIISTKSFLKNKTTHGKKVLPFVVNQLYVDIDHKRDFEYAKFLMKKLRIKL